MIENLLNQVFVAYCAPRPAAWSFFWEVLLDSSILPLGSKVKAAMAIAQHLEVDFDQQSLHRLISLRNAFAHHATDAHATLVVGKAPDPDRREHQLHVISNSGRVSRTARENALTQFDEAFEAAKRSLLDLLAKARTGGEPESPEQLDV